MQSRMPDAQLLPIACRTTVLLIQLPLTKHLRHLSAGGFGVALVGTVPKLEGPSLVRRVVTFRSGRSPGLRVFLPGLTLPIGIPTVGSGLQPRLQWRYHGGFSPPSLFSLGGHLNGQWLYIYSARDSMPSVLGCQGDIHTLAGMLTLMDYVHLPHEYPQHRHLRERKQSRDSMTADPL